MKYEKPEIVVLGSAVQAVQNSLAKHSPSNDDNELTTPSAYSADE
jgi:hypothetical protein